MIELLESIDKNTSVLSDIFNVLEENTKDKKAILDIIGDFNSLATINEPEKAQSKYRKIMNKLNTILTDANTFQLCVHMETWFIIYYIVWGKYSSIEINEKSVVIK